MATPKDKEERLKKLFVGGLKRVTPEDTLRSYFEHYGEITDCVVIVDGEKQSRGFGYVTFGDEESVLKALEDKREKGPHCIDEKEVEVKRAIPRDVSQSSTAHLKTKKIFIGGLPDEANAESIKQGLADQVRGILPVSVDLIMKKEDETKHRGFCFVEFEDEDIVDELCCIKNVPISGKEVEIKKAEPKDKQGSQGQRGRGGRGGGGRGGFASRGRGRGSYQPAGGYDVYQGGYEGYGSYGSYGDPSYAYGYNPAYQGYDYNSMGTYPQAPSGYGVQGGGRQARYRPY